MSREAYQPPTLQLSNQNVAGNASYQAAQAGAGAVHTADPASKPVVYHCGDCNAKVPLKRGEAIRCKDCGHRVLYKERTTRMVQFEAR